MGKRAEVDAAAGGIVVREGAVAVVHRSRYDDWTLPKGHLDEGETFEEAAIREVFEETGAALPVHYVLPDGRPKVVLFFPMHPTGGERRDLDADEVDSVEWHEPDELLGKLTYAAERELIERWRDGR